MKPWRPSGLTRIVGLALALSVFTACNEDGTTGPGGADPEATAQAIQGITDQFFTNNEAVQSINGLGPLIASSLGGIPPLSVMLSEGPALRRLADGVWAFQSAGVFGPQLAPEEIPPALLGTQWMLDPETLMYVLDPEPDADVPENGVRFELYSVNPINGQPVIPLDEIGYLDLIDTSQLPNITIQMLAVVQDLTLINLTSAATMTGETSFIITGDGFISDGTGQLGIDLDIVGDAPSEDDIDLQGTLALTAPDNVNITATLDALVTATTAVITAGLSIVSPDGSISFTLDIDGISGDISGQVLFGGTIVALISGNIDSENVTITNAQGGDLTQAELAALEELFTIFFEVLAGAAGILALVFVLFGFAF